VEVVASPSQGRTAAAQCGLFTYKSVPVIFEPPCTYIILKKIVFQRLNFIANALLTFVGLGYVVGTATRYGLHGPGIESLWGRDFPQLSIPALEPTQPPIQWVPALSRRQSGRSVAPTTHTHLVPRLKKE